MTLLTIILLITDWSLTLLSWLVPMGLSSITGGVVGYGSFRFAQGQTLQRITTLERDTGAITKGQEQFVTQGEFDLLREDLRDIKTDVREIRRATSNRY